jgi:two-component system, OmpR family, response regulator
MTGTRRRILVIEDDPETARQLVDFLGTRGYHVDLALNGNDGLRLGLSSGYAVMTVDRMLPGVDGLAIIRQVRDAGIDTPALIISAVRGLRGGGDDYLVKPFAFAELLARVEALARRGAAPRWSRKWCCASAISSSISCRAPQIAAARKSIYCRGNSRS